MMDYILLKIKELKRSYLLKNITEKINIKIHALFIFL
jgi:hypothetical protein